MLSFFEALTNALKKKLLAMAHYLSIVWEYERGAILLVAWREPRS